jgi:formylglycine-generating enzyme
MDKNLKLVLILLALVYQSASATSLLETFGTGANEFTMDFVTIGNPGNAGDTTANLNPLGSVAYTYNLAKYEVSRGQFEKADSAGSLGITMHDMSDYGGNGLLKPATGVSWYEAAKFVNWLNTSTGNTAAYKFDGSGNYQVWSTGDAGYNANNIFRNSLAKYVIASRNEWYKGAYGNPDGSWSFYPNGGGGYSDDPSPPTPVAGGTEANTAVYGPQYGGPANVNNAGGLSGYGTMGQGGNVMEWNESAYTWDYGSINSSAIQDREVRDGSFTTFFGDDYELASGFHDSYNPSDNLPWLGFRVASVGVPEPSTSLLVVLGLSGLLLKRRKTVTV